MNEPVSLWTFGVRGLRNYLAGLKFYPFNNAILGVNYHWDDNRIDVELWVDIENTSREECSNLINKTREAGGVVDGEYKKSLSNSVFSDYFKQIGYISNKEPDNYLSRLDRIFRVKVHIFQNDQTISCQGPLVSTQILYEAGGGPSQ